MMVREKGGGSVAETKERHTGLVALGVLALGLKYAADAAMHLVGEEWTRILDIMGTGFGLAAALLIVPIVAWKVRNRDPQQRRSYFNDQSFTATAIRKAHVASWAATLFILLAFELASDALPQLGPAFFVESTLAVMFASLSLSFVILNHVPGWSGSDD